MHGKYGGPLAVQRGNISSTIRRDSLQAQPVLARYKYVDRFLDAFVYRLSRCFDLVDFVV